MKKPGVNDSGYYICHIQEISEDKQKYVVFVEGTGEKITVPFKDLKILPSQYSSWGSPVKYWQNNNYRKRPLNIKSYRTHESSNKIIDGLLRRKDKYTSSIYASQGKLFAATKCNLEIDQITNLDQYQTYSQDYITMPAFADNNNDNRMKQDTPAEGGKPSEVEEKKISTEEEPPAGTTYDSAYNSYHSSTQDQNVSASTGGGGYEYDGQPSYTPSIPYYQTPTAAVPAFCPWVAPPPNTPAYGFTPYTPIPRTPVFGATPMHSSRYAAASPSIGQVGMRISRVTGMINYQAPPSQHLDGSDLPCKF